MQLLADLVARVRAEVDGSKLKEFHKDLGEGTQSAGLKGVFAMAGVAAGGLLMGGAVLGAGKMAVDALGGMVGKALEANRGIAQTNAVLASTHGVSGQTAQSISALADHLKQLDGVDDDVVRSAANMLLTFTNIKGDTFPAATQAAMDMSAALGEDATSAAMQLGKALNDPIAGVSALQRVGVKLTETQQKNIADAVKHGDVAKAQGIILKELGTEFGGSAKAAGDAAGPMNRLSLMWSDMQKLIGNALLPIINQLVTAIQPAVEQFGQWLPGALRTASDAVQPVIAALKNLGPALQGVGAVMLFLAQNGDMVKTVLGALGIAIGIVLIPAFVAWAIAAGAAAIATIAATWPIIAIIAAITLLIVGIKLLVDHWGQISKWLQDTWSKVVQGVQLGLQVLGQFFSDLGKNVHDALANAIQAIIQWGVDLVLRFMRARDEANTVIGNLVSNIVSFFAGLPGRVFGFIANLVGGVVGGFIDMELRGWGVITSFLGGLISRFLGAVGAAASAVGAIKDAILGGLANLGAQLAQKARDAIDAMISAIKGMAGKVGGAIGGLFSHFHIPGFASGGVMEHSGFAMVGEKGPELVALPAGSQVYPHGASPLINTGSPRVTTGSGGGGSTGTPVEVVFQLDGREIARQLWPSLVTEAHMSGVRIG